MHSLVLAACLSVAIVAIPALVFCAAARRVWLSRSRNALLYWLVGGYAFAGAAGALRTGLLGGQMDAGGAVVALASLPMWLLVRRIAGAGSARRYAARVPVGPVFASARRARARG